MNRPGSRPRHRRAGRRPDRLSRTTFSSVICSLSGIEEMGDDVLVQLGLPLEELQDAAPPSDWPAGAPSGAGAIRRSDRPGPSARRTGSPSWRSRSLVHDHVITQQPQGDSQSGPEEQEVLGLSGRWSPAGGRRPAGIARGARRTAAGRIPRRCRRGPSGAGPGPRAAGTSWTEASRIAASDACRASRSMTRAVSQTSRPSDARKTVRIGETRSATPAGRPPGHGRGA